MKFHITTRHGIEQAIAERGDKYQQAQEQQKRTTPGAPHLHLGGHWGKVEHGASLCASAISIYFIHANKPKAETE